MKKYTTDQLETAFEFCRIVNERGGYMINGYEGGLHHCLPNIHGLINNPEYYAHLPKPPRKVMMQMFRYGDSLTLHGVSASLSDHYNYDRSSWEKIGEPFEFVFPEGDNT